MGRAAEPISVWNANVGATVSYQQLTAASKPEDWVYVDARLLHPTQFCLGYREVAYRAKTISEFPADRASHSQKSSLYPYLAKKDIPIIVAPDGTPYLTDGHHTLAALIASSQSDKTAFGHVVANFYGKSQSDFIAYMTDPKNNDAYLYGAAGNGLLNTPGAMGFDSLPKTIYSADTATRMTNDPYRSLGWAMKETGYLSKPDKKHGEDALWENFIEFRWGDLFRDKISWNNESDDSFYIAAENADTLAHSETGTDITGGFAARDLPGYIPAKPGQALSLNITNDTRIEGDITPPAEASTTLDINAAADSTIVISGKLSDLSQVRINAGGRASPVLEKGKFNPQVVIAPGSGTVILAGHSAYSGATSVSAGRLVVTGSLDNSAVQVGSGATLCGSGSVGAICGGGTVAPGCSTGILTATTLDPSQGLCLAFELTAAAPVYERALNSRNDVLVLTDGTPLSAPMSAANSIDIYFRVPVLKNGETLTGGIFAKGTASFADSISSAKVRYFIVDPRGATIHGTTHYSPIDLEQFTVAMDVVPVKATFAAGSEAGFITRFSIGSKR